MAFYQSQVKDRPKSGLPIYTLHAKNMIEALLNGVKAMKSRHTCMAKWSPIDPVSYHLLVSNKEKQGKPDANTAEKTKEKEEKYILCKQCENRISHPSNRMEMDGIFEHTFLNPGGHVFRIGCFEAADGCMALGVPTSDWTWFEGFEWQVAICGQCNIHLGWFYRSMNDQNFYGLILDLLI